MLTPLLRRLGGDVGRHHGMRSSAATVHKEGIAMPDKAEVLDAVRAALSSQPRVDLHSHPIALDFADGVLTLAGEVASVAAKKLALEAAAALPPVAGIVDRLRVAPAERLGDGAIRDLTRDALLQEPAFADCALKEWVKGRTEVVRDPPVAPAGIVEIAVADGVVTLNGTVPGLSHKRLAGVLAWWVPGSREVTNGLVVEPPEEDHDGMVTDAVRLALEKDPFVNASQVRVSTRDWVVTLQGLVPTESERDMAEADAWYVFGVDRVVNEIDVRA
jgi:osmotically-inducible protein OsmY